MNAQYTMFGPTTSEVTPNATSLPASESGATPCVSPDGRTTAKSGPAPAPASPSARPAKARRSTMKGIFGQSGFLSSKHEDLSSALANRYRALTDSLGSTLFTLTWTVRITPSGFSIPAQRASEPRTEDSVCIGWPTPQSSDTTGGGQAKRADGRANLNDFAMLAGWPTATVNDATGSQYAYANGDHNKPVPKLPGAAMLSRWKTPTACSPNSLRGNGQEPTDREAGGHAVNLQDQVRLTAWKTPCVPNGGRISGNAEDLGKHRDGTKAQIGLENEAKLSGWRSPSEGDSIRGVHPTPDVKAGAHSLNNEARLTAFGEQPIGYLLGPNGWEIVPACGQLNAAHSRWLMGLPPEWDACGVTAMASLRGRRRRS